MRKRFIFILFFVVLLLVGIFIYRIPKIQIMIDSMVHTVLIPYKMAQLYQQDPDTALSMPLMGIRVSDIANTWGAGRSGGRKHEGQDIFAAKGTPIYSATYGFVTRVGSNNLGGNTVSVMGAGGRSYYYAHLSSYGPDAIVGREVGTSSIIGFVGNSGDAATTPPHLHFGIYTKDGVIDPLPLLLQR